MNHEPTHPPAEAILAHSRWVARLARTLVRGEDRVADVVQQTWVQALRFPARPGTNLRAWLASITRSVVRRTRQTEALQERLAKGASRFGPKSPFSPEETVQRVMLERRVSAAVLRLSEPYREVVLLRYFHDLPPRKVAEALGVPVETVRTRLKRALAQLRAELDRDFGDDGEDWRLALAPLVWVRNELTLTGAALKLALLGALLVGSLVVVWQIFWTAPPDPVRAVAAGTVVTDFEESLHPRVPHDAIQREPVDAETIREDASHGDGASLTGAVLVHVLWPDGSPAERAGVVLYPNDVSEPYLLQREAVTGSNGTCKFTGVPPGRASVGPLNQVGLEMIEVIAGQQTEVTLRIKPGLLVRGVVVDQLGNPIAGASIWASIGLGVPGDGQVIATSDGDGTFAIPHLSKWQFLSAWTRGFAPSLTYPVRSFMQAPKGPVEMRLELPGPGGDLEGWVVDQAGQPVADAVVIVGELPERVDRRSTSDMRYRAVQRRFVTGADGTFAVQGLLPGTVPLGVRAPGYAMASKAVEVTAGSTAYTTIALVPGATFRGVVSTPVGEPVKGCVIIVSGWEEGADIPNAHSYRLEGSRAETGSDGRFSIENTLVGSVMVEAFVSGGRRTRTGMELHSGEIATWDPVLPDCVTLEGRLVDDLDRPLVDWRVSACAGFESYAFTRTNEEGRFILEQLADVPHTLSIWAPFGAAERFLPGPPVAVLGGISPRGRPLLLRLTDQMTPSARVTGTILDAAGRPFTGAEIWSERADAPGYPLISALDAEPGHFEVGPLPPATYSLTLYVRGGLKAQLGEHELSAQQTLNLGTVYIDEERP
ncbi:MAG: sigma-70 family RNA polymerase sigma factor [Planctomycetota bacterium]